MTRDARLALRDGIVALRAAGVDDPAVDARRLMEHAAGIPPGMLSAYLPDRIDSAALTRFDALVLRRSARAPVAHLTGQRAFYGRSFLVTPDTLDPRPDTEILVDIAMREPYSRVLDLGTGTGCILLTLLAEDRSAIGVGADISPAALQVATRNADRLGLGDRVEFVVSDWFSAISGRFDLILSNPPYIALEEMSDLAPEVRDHEPHLALTDGGDGLSAYRAIAARSWRYLAPGGRLIVETGWQQAAAVSAIFRDGGLADVSITPDLNGRERVVAARMPQDAAQ